MALDLGNIRQEIDKIDDEMLALFQKRMECSKQVAEYKVEHGLPVLNATREQQILDDIASKAGDNATRTELLFSTIMNISRGAQYPLVTKQSPVRDIIKSALNLPFSPQKIGFQGTNGSYSQMALKKLFPNSDDISFTHFEDVFKAVHDGKIDAGVLPCENSYAGTISENFDLLLKYDLKINAMTDLTVNHCLLVKKGADLSKIKTVYSHRQALSQCAEYITEHGFEPVAMENTAFAAKYVAESNDCTIAAIASESTAELYGLEIAKVGVQSAKQNFTRFMTVSRNLTANTDADLVSIAFSLPHTAGSLYKMLSMLASAGLNMTRIESRPDKESPFRYVFYVDFEGNIKDETVASMLCGLYDELPMMKILGNCKII